MKALVYNANMSMQNKLNEALKGAMRSGDSARKNTLRLALTAIKLAEVEKKSALDDAAILGILQKEVKARKEAAADAQHAGRDDLVAKAEAEIAILEEFLPQALSREELETLIQETIAQVGAASPGDMGKVMKAVMPRVQGRAEGGEVSQLVRQILQDN